MKKILKWGLIGFIGLIVLGALFGSSNDKKPTSTTTTTQSEQVVAEPTETPEPTKKSTGVTMEQFTSLKTGMSYEEVVTILGSEGEELSSIDIEGYSTIMYMWNGSSFASNMNATFQNNKLISKAQFGLK